MPSIKNVILTLYITIIISLLFTCSKPHSNQLVVEPYSEVGEYGGSLVTGWLGLDDKWGASKFSEEYLMTFDKTGHKVIGNLVDSWKVSSDNTEYNFHLREGIFWSDGEPFTTDDINFFWKEILNGTYQEYLNRAVWLVKKESVSLIVDDKYNFTIKFKEPTSYFLRTLITEFKEVFLPEHYYKQILPKYIGEEKAMLLAKELGFSDLDTYLKWIINFGFLYPGVPTLRPWVAVNNPTEPIFIMERNPYYWKVDSLGNKLPYIDDIKFINSINTENIESLIYQGIINFQARHLKYKELNTLSYDHTDYYILDTKENYTFHYSLQFNLQVQDPYLNDLFNNKKFRTAISLGINRSVFNDKRVEQVCLPQSSNFYLENWGKQAVDYDYKASINMLKSLGIVYIDGIAHRGDNLEPLTIYLDSIEEYDQTIVELIEMLHVIGITAEFRSYSRTSLVEAMNRNNMNIYVGDFIPESFLFDATSLIPLRPKSAIFGPINDSSTLSGDILKLYNVWDSLDGSEGDTNKIQEIYQIYERNLWVISTKPSELINNAVIVNKNIQNLEPNLLFSDYVRSPGNLRLYQVWIEK